MRLRVNPNRMELLRLRRRLVLAERGHKLLEDKLDELMRLFLKSLEEAKGLQEEIDIKIKDAFLSLMLARSQMNRRDFEEAIIPKDTLKINFQTKRIMNLTLPSISIERIPLIFNPSTTLRVDGERPFDRLGVVPSEVEGRSRTINYSFIKTSSELDIALLKLLDLIPKIIRLAELHKICGILSSEIERTRRRTNALEYILIPSIKETIDYITDRLSEFERANITRLMRIKEIIRAH